MKPLKVELLPEQWNFVLDALTLVPQVSIRNMAGGLLMEQLQPQSVAPAVAPPTEAKPDKPEGK